MGIAAVATSLATAFLFPSFQPPTERAASGPTFSPIARYANPDYAPGGIDCVGSFCMRIDFGNEWGQANGFSATDSVSTDGGATWHVGGVFPLLLKGDETQAALSTTLSCISVGLCYAHEDNALLVTSNSGATWSRVGIPEGQAVEGLACVRTGCVVTTYPVVSGDSVTTYWVPRDSKRIFRVAGELQGVNALVLACSGSTRCVLIANSDPGDVVYVASRLAPSLVWARVGGSPTATVDSLACPTAVRCFAVETLSTKGGSRTVLADSSNFGETFTTSRSLPLSGESSVSCGAPADCAVTYLSFDPKAGAGFLADSYATSDGGTSWQARSLFSTTDYPEVHPMSADVACSAPSTCVLDLGAFVGATIGGFVERSTDLSTWSYVASPYSPTGILSVQCTESSTCYEIISDPTTTQFASELRVSSDDGSTWSDVSLPPGDEPVVIGGCQSASTCEVIAVEGEELFSNSYPIGDQSTATTLLLTTTDGGGQWNVVTASSRGYAPLEGSCSAVTQCSVLLYHPSTSADYLDSTNDGTD